MKIFIKNILLGAGVIITLLLTDYIQIQIEIYFKSSLFRWVFGLIVSILACYIVLFPIFRVLNADSGQEELESLEENEVKVFGVRLDSVQISTKTYLRDKKLKAD